MRVTLPTGMSLMDWADQIALDLDPYGTFGRLMDESQWQNWGMQFLNNMTLKETFPIPYQFDDWKQWAERFCQVLE